MCCVCVRACELQGWLAIVDESLEGREKEGGRERERGREREGEREKERARERESKRICTHAWMCVKK